MSILHPIGATPSAQRKGDVVFIHGLGGDAFATWRHGADDSTSWPHWLAKDFPDIGVWSLGYAASPTRWGHFLRKKHDHGFTMPLPDRAGEVLNLMVQQKLGDRPLMF
ncbi:MAG TPA: hypothetical protein PLE80_05100, partial [Opitutaceae bacterium]|nr:hypothetical protein [Opitutaceae bacterium]